MDIEPPDPESMLDDLFTRWDELFAEASFAHERVKMIQNKLKLIPPTSRDPTRDALVKEMDAAVLQVDKVAADIREFCGNRNLSPPEG
jgi:hypothetical protein